MWNKLIICVIFWYKILYGDGLKIIGFDPIPGSTNVPFDTHFISFTFDEDVAPGTGFIQMYIEETEDRWISSLSVAVDGPQVSLINLI